MAQKRDLEALWAEISSNASVDERRNLIYSDIETKKPKFKVLAEEDPYRLFNLLEGDEADICRTNWAYEYTYEDYAEDNGLDYDEEEADNWDLEKESIQHAHDTGHWYVTGICTIEGPDGIELPFEFAYSEGYLDGIIGTPYNQEKHGRHGIEFG
jgi:hypothetical protein